MVSLGRSASGVVVCPSIGWDEHDRGRERVLALDESGGRFGGFDVLFEPVALRPAVPTVEKRGLAGPPLRNELVRLEVTG